MNAFSSRPYDSRKLLFVRTYIVTKDHQPLINVFVFTIALAITRRPSDDQSTQHVVSLSNSVLVCLLCCATRWGRFDDRRVLLIHRDSECIANDRNERRGYLLLSM